MEWPYDTTLVTGGTGTFGQAFTRCLMHLHDSARLRIFSRDEYKQHQMAERWGKGRLSFLLGDVRDVDRLRLALRGVQCVIHAAALKHVPAGEYNPLEFVRTNIDGTANVVRACIDEGVEVCVLLSSDKAVNPINLYGATKLAAEKLVTRANAYTPQGTVFTAVRYGNIANSRGSVIEIFQRLKQSGAPMLPLTDLGMTRFWMTIEHAVALVVFAALERQRGALIIPHLPAFAIRTLIAAFGMNAHITGIRPGEKLAERLMTEDEQARAWLYSQPDDLPIYYRVPPLDPAWQADPPAGWTPVAHMMDHAGQVEFNYESGGWPYQLDIGALRERLEEVIGEPA